MRDDRHETSSASVFKRFTKTTCRHIREDLRVFEGAVLPIPSPAALYEKHYEDVCAAIDRLLGKSSDAGD
jgi:predicted RNase H-like nuclease